MWHPKTTTTTTSYRKKKKKTHTSKEYEKERNAHLLSFVSLAWVKRMNCVRTCKCMWIWICLWHCVLWYVFGLFAPRPLRNVILFVRNYFISFVNKYDEKKKIALHKQTSNSEDKWNVFFFNEMSTRKPRSKRTHPPPKRRALIYPIE